MRSWVLGLSLATAAAMVLLLALAAVPVAEGHGAGAHAHGRHRRKKHLVDRRPPEMSRYHSGEELQQLFMQLQNDCPHVTVHTKRGSEKELMSVRINKRVEDGAAPKKMKTLLYFGEHARELISPETALRFTQVLCNVHPSGYGLPDHDTQAQIDHLLNNVEIELFPMINGDGHSRVVRGAYCARTNSRGVDLNRNWDDHWERSRARDTNSGKRAFSEDEVRILRDAAHALRPDLFVSIHSGALGMYTPYAYSRARPSGPAEARMVQILHKLNPKYCDCDVGAAGKELNYLCPGTCLDYMFDKLRTPYAFAIEIWDGAHGYSKHKHKRAHTALIETSSNAVQQVLNRVKSSVADHDAERLQLGSCFIQENEHGKAAEAAEADADSETAAKFPAPRTRSLHTCLASFNPTNTADYLATTDNWSRALLDLITNVHVEFEQNEGAHATAAAADDSE